MGERWRKIEGRWETEHNREQDDDGITLAQVSPAGRAGLTLATVFFDSTFPFVGSSWNPHGSSSKLVHTSPLKSPLLVLPNSRTGNFATGFREPIP